MRDVNRSERDEDELDARPRTMTPRAARPLTSRRTSFSGLTSGASSTASTAGSAPATTTTATGQGSFVASFSMPRNEQVAYLELAKSHLPQLVAECARSDRSNSRDSDDNQWRRVKFKKKSDVHVWEKGDDVSSSGSRAKPSAVATLHASDNRIDNPNALSASPPAAQLYAVRSAVRVPAPLDVVLKTLDCSAVTTYRSFTKIIYESLVADTSVLFHSQSSGSPTDTPTVTVPVTPCTASESLAVRWLVCRCNNPMVSDCDLCLLEYAKVTSVDDAPPRYDGKPLFTIRAKNNSSSGNGNQSGHGSSSRSHEGLHDRREFPSAYKILCSIETKSCPELLDSHRLARCVVPLGGFLFYPTDNVDVTDVVFYMSIAPSSSSSNRQFRATQRVLQHMARGVGRIKNAVDAYTMSLRLEMLRNTRWVHNTERAECVVCYRRFHQLTRRRHHCRLCGDVICRDCSVYRDADLPTIGPTVLRICKLCDLNELKTSAGAAAAAATMNTSSSKAAAALEPEDVPDDATPALAKPLARKRSTTLSVDTTKAAVLAAADEPEIGRRFTTVVDGKDRRELPEQAFSCSKADIARRTHKWNTGGGGKPLVILSPTSAALYATRTGGARSAAVDAKSARFAKAMTPTGKTTAPQDWHAAVHPSSHVPSSAFAPAPFSNQFQAKSCSKMASSHDRFASFDKAVLRGKESALQGQATVLNQESEREDQTDASASRQPHHAARVVKSGKLVVPEHELDAALSHDGASKRKATAAVKTSPKRAEAKGNQHKDTRSELTLRKLPRLDEYNDILLTLCEQVSKALACKYAALSLFTPSPHPTPATAATPTTGGGHRHGGSLPPSPTLSAASFETVHYLKAAGSKKLTTVAASLMCCAPVLELKEKLVTRDALGSCNVFDFKRLPIVIGPQQVRFYAGIPLVDSSGQMLGALAVFDANVYQSSSLAHVLPSMEALATVALSAIEARKTDVEIKSFLRRPLVDTTRDNQATRVSDPVFHIDLDLRDSSGLDSGVEFEYDADDDVDFEYPARRSSVKEAQIRQGYAARSTPLRSPSPSEAPDAACDIEYYKNQMEQLVRQARETEAQMLETSMAMKRQGVAIW